MSEHPTVFPTMSYRDADAAIDFLQRAFGAEPHAVYRDEQDRVRHAELRLGNGMVMLVLADAPLAAATCTSSCPIPTSIARARPRGRRRDRA